MFLDATALAVMAMLIGGRRVAGQNAPYLSFTAGLFVILSGLVAYIVTNFGTMFRLRVMLATLLWLLPLALVRRTGDHDATLYPWRRAAHENARSPHAEALTLSYVFVK